ncbi:MAG: hypothetical protein M3O22_06945 [Pseudomonadota bacterium]|nr:hypothetical protein [Pseudomonadota bacterium]
MPHLKPSALLAIFGIVTGCGPQETEQPEFPPSIPACDLPPSHQFNANITPGDDGDFTIYADGKIPVGNTLCSVEYRTKKFVYENPDTGARVLNVWGQITVSGENSLCFPLAPQGTFARFHVDDDSRAIRMEMREVKTGATIK